MTDKLVPLPVWPAFDDDFLAATRRVLESGKVNYWTGPEGRAFESEFARWIGTRHAIAVANGTVALEMPLEAAGIGAGDEVIVTPRTFIASASAAVRLGAIPVFADVDRDSGNIDASSIEKVLTTKTKAIIVVHLAGWPAEMDEILELARDHGILVLEDCAQSHGATYRGQMTGALSEVAAFSFCQDKIMTTLGEGGMVTTSNAELWDRMWSIKDHGKDYRTVFEKQHPPGFRWLHESFGTNYRMTEVQSAAGRVALGKIDGWIARRLEIAARYRAALADRPVVRVPVTPAHSNHVYYRFYAYVEPARLASGWSRDRIMTELNALGVPCLSGTCSEIYFEQAFEKRGWTPQERLPVARELGETTLQFPMHPLLTNEQVDRMMELTRDVLDRATAR